jgi:ribonuclease D
MFIQSFVDITQIFKTLNPNEKFSSLSFLCLKFLNRRLSKYEQRSNWNRRPLRKAQIHYAALDAFACVLIYEKLLPEYQELQKHGKLYKAKLIKNYVSPQQSNDMEEKEMV